MKHIKKKSVVLGLIVALLALNSGCSKGEETITLNLENVATQVIENTSFEDTLSRVDNKLMEVMFGINPEFIKESVVYMGTGATSEMLAFFEVTDASHYKETLSALEVYMSDLESSFKDYNPASYDLVKDTKIVQKGNYLLICVTPDPSAFQKAITE